MGSTEPEVCWEQTTVSEWQKRETWPRHLPLHVREVHQRNMNRAHLNMRLWEWLPAYKPWFSIKISLVQAVFVSICWQECQLINTILLPDTYRAEKDSISDIIISVLTAHLSGSIFPSPCVASLLIFTNAYLAPSVCKCPSGELCPSRLGSLSSHS